MSVMFCKCVVVFVYDLKGGDVVLCVVVKGYGVFVEMIVVCVYDVGLYVYMVLEMVLLLM